MFSNESVKHAEACRYCWMCRHICPVSNVTGMEAWSPRVRGFMVSMVERGFEYDKTLANDMYMCCLCDACADDCASGVKPNIFIREARTEAIVRNLAPDSVMNALETLNTSGNIYGAQVDPRINDAIAALPERADVVLFLGQTGTTKSAETGLAAISLLKKAGVNFTVLKNEPESGILLSELIGFTGDVQEQAKRAAAAIMATGAKTLVALDPHDACIFMDQYSQWNLLPGVEMQTASYFMAKLIAEGKLAPKKLELTASYQDPCRLSRGVGEMEPAREIMNSLGVELKEMFLNRNLGRCCGGPVLNSYAPEIVKDMVNVREQDAIRMDSNCIITACPACQYLMNMYGSNVTFRDLYVLLDQQC